MALMENGGGHPSRHSCRFPTTAHHRPPTPIIIVLVVMITITDDDHVKATLFKGNQ